MILLLSFLLTATLGAEEVLFEERFEGDLLSGVWEVLEGVARAERGGVRLLSWRENSRLSLRRTFSGDLSVAVRLVNVTGSHWGGFLLYETYQLTVNSEFQALLLRKFSCSGRGEEIGRFENYSAIVWNPDDLRLRLDIVGGTLRAYLDGKCVIEAKDPSPAREGAFSLIGGYGSDLLFDDLSVRRWNPDLEPPPPPTRATPSLPELRAHLERPDGVFYDGEPVSVDVSWRATNAEVLRLRYELVDVDERVVTQRRSETTSRAGVLVRERVVFRPGRRGVFKVRLTLSDESGRLSPQGDLVSFVVLPRELGARPPHPASRFGGHPHAEAADYHNALARKIGMRWARNHDTIQYTWWTWVQPEPETWRWFDDEVDALRASGLELLGEFLYVPSWASSAPATAEERLRKTSPPRNLADFDRYVYETVRHYRGRIRVWEVWNEPHWHAFWRGTANEYVQLLRVAYAAAKRADPACFILGGGGFSLRAKEWVLEALDAGLLRYCDALSFHYADIRRDVDLDRFAGDIAWLRDQMRLRGDEKPLWNTEEGIFTTSFLDTYRQGYTESGAVYHFREAAYRLVKTYVGNFANGVEKVFYYDLLRPSREPFLSEAKERPLGSNLVEIGGSLKPIAVAHATTATWLDETTFSESYRFGGSGRAYVFSRGEERVVVAWSGEPLALPLAGSWKVVDVMGNVAETTHRFHVDAAPRFYLFAPDVWLACREVLSSLQDGK